MNGVTQQVKEVWLINNIRCAHIIFVQTCSFFKMEAESPPVVPAAGTADTTQSNVSTTEIVEPVVTSPHNSVPNTTTPPVIAAPMSIFARATAQAPVHTIPPELKVIDWDEALVQIGDDEEFLFEVLGDLDVEAIEAQTEIGDALKAKDFSSLMKAAHRIKGSTSYLACEIVNHCALKMEVLASSHTPGSTTPATCTPDEAWVQVEGLFVLFNQGLVCLKAEIAVRSANK